MSLFEDRAEARRWGGAFLIVAAAHALPALVAAFWLGPVISTPPAVEPAIMIDMAPPAAPPVPPSEQPPGPKQVKAVTPRLKLQDDPIRTPPVPNPAVAMPVAPPQVDKQPAPETAAPPARPLPPAPAPSNAAPTWQGLLLGQLDKFKRYPALAQYRREQGVPYIRFVMDRNGKVLSSRLERSSGYPDLDTEAVSLPRRAQPLPKPPPEVLGDTIELVVPVEFFIK